MSVPRDLADVLADPGTSVEQVRRVLHADLDRSAAELGLARSGVPVPVTVAFAAQDDALLAVVPVVPALRADPDAVGERGWLLCAAAVGALVEAGAAAAPEAGAADGALLLRATAHAPEAELAALALEEQVAPIDRLRARGLVVPAAALDVTEEPRALATPSHPLAVAARIAALGGRPADLEAADRLEEEVLAAAGPAPRPHDDPDPARRVARRIAQRLDGMGKWGGYHTEWAHLARGFAGNDRRLAEDVGEAMLRAGLLREKPSVGQRHVCLDPSHAREVRALVERGEVPSALVLPDP